tara:strand:- start:2675 stop:3568 length:894 start_codon:yes stop_codon:yes gene_type:complete
MEMIDVLTRLKQIAESKPELVKDAVENVEKTNPKVDEGRLKDYLHDEAEKLSREEFIKKHGESLRGFYNSINGDEDDDTPPESMEGKMPAGLKAYHDKKAGKKEKEDMKEAIQISTDSPEEASMMMQILKLAGVQQVTPGMMGAEPEHGSDMDPGAMNKQMDTPSDDDAVGSMDMARMRDVIKNPEDEQKEETFANEPEEKVQDVDSLVNKHSGGLNRQKKTYPKVASGDNPMAYAEDKITEEDLANSLRAQYESFKSAYQTEAKKAKPDFLDMDKDGNKTEPMKKAVKDKEEKEAK